MTYNFNVPRSEVEQIIDQWCFNEKYRAILKRRFLDGVLLEPLAEEFNMSVRQIQNINYMYDNGHSYRNRDSMGRYSRTGGYNGHMNNNYTYRNGYSRTGDMAAKLESMMSEATTDREREAIQRALEQM